jgi:hypothetical protein
MDAHRMAVALALAAPAAAQAATVANPIVGCKAESDSKKVLEFIAKNDATGLEKFKTSKIAGGDCSSLSKGMSVAIDKKDGQFLCVRPTGGFDCFWTAAVAINQNPTDSEKSQSSQPRGHGRGGGRMPQF